MNKIKTGYVPPGMKFKECMRLCKNSLKQDKYINKPESKSLKPVSSSSATSSSASASASTSLLL